MATIITRREKGDILSWEEGDDNFTNLNNDKLEKDIYLNSPAATITNTDKTNWNSKSNFSGDYNDLAGKPTLFSGNYNDLQNLPDLNGFINSVRVMPPAGFRWQSAPITILRTPNGFEHDLDPIEYMPPVVNTWYVDPVNGVDATALVNDRFKPLLNLATALAKTDVDQIVIINLTNTFVGRITRSWNNVQPSRSVSVIREGNFDYVSAKTASSNPPTWAVDATYSNIFYTGSTAANSNQVCDFSLKAKPFYVDDNDQVITLTNAKDEYRMHKKVNSKAEVAAEAGTFFNDGTNTFVRAFDDRNLIGDPWMQPLPTASNNGRFPTTINNLTIYVKGISFVGGTPFYASVPSNITGCKLILEDCSFQGSGSNSNGLNVAFNSPLVVVYKCGCYSNWADGFNYHSFESDGTTSGTSPNVLEVDCVSKGNGSTGSAQASDNASTGHDYANIIRVNSILIDSNDRVLADTNYCHSWTIGGFVGQPTNTDNTTPCVAALTSAEMWLDSVSIKSGSKPKVSSTETAKLKHSNCGSIANTVGSTGLVKAYIG